MARKRHARAGQLERTVGNAGQSFVDLLLSKDGPSFLTSWIEYYKDQVALFTELLRRRNETPEQLEKDSAQFLREFVKRPAGLTILEEDLPGISQVLGGMTRVPTTGSVPAGDCEAARKLFNHLLVQQPRLPRIKPAFAQAYLARMEAKRRGMKVTTPALTNRFMPYEYSKNPASALRSMERGIKRAGEVYRRCAELGIQFPPQELPTKGESKRHKK